MKLLAKILIAAAFVMLIAPIAAQAQDSGFHHGYHAGWRHYDRVRDRRDLRSDWRDIGRDRFRMHRNIMQGNWQGARAQRADLRGDRADVRYDRRDFYRDHRHLPHLDYSTSR